MAGENNEILEVQSVFQSLSKSAKELATIENSRSKSNRERKKELKDLIQVDQDSLKILLETRYYKKKVIGDLIIEQKAVDALSDTLKELDKHLKDTIKDEDERLAILKEFAKIGVPKKREMGELSKAWGEFSKTTSSFSSILGVLGKSLTKFLGPAALLFAAYQIANGEQAQKRLGSSIFGMSGKPLSLSEVMFGGGGKTGFSSLTKLRQFGGAVGMSSEEILGYGSKMAAQLTVGNKGGQVSDIVEASIASIAIQKRFGTDAGDNEKLIYFQRFQTGATKTLGLSLLALTEDVKGTALNVPKYFKMLGELLPTNLKFGASIEQGRGFMLNFTDALATGALTVGDYSRAISGLRSAGTPQLAGLAMLAQRFGVSTKGIKGLGSDPVLNSAIMREYAGTNPEDTLKLALKTSKAAANQAGFKDPRSQWEFMTHMFPNIPGVEAFANMPLSTKINGKTIDMRTAMFEWTEGKGTFKGKTLEELKDLLPKDAQQQMYTDVTTMAVATANLSSIVQQAFHGGAFAVFNTKPSTIPRVGEINRNFMEDVGKSMMGWKWREKYEPNYDKNLYFRDKKSISIGDVTFLGSKTSSLIENIESFFDKLRDKINYEAYIQNENKN